MFVLFLVDEPQPPQLNITLYNVLYSLSTSTCNAPELLPVDDGNADKTVSVGVALSTVSKPGCNMSATSGDQTVHGSCEAGNCLAEEKCGMDGNLQVNVGEQISATVSHKQAKWEYCVQIGK